MDVRLGFLNNQTDILLSGDDLVSDAGLGTAVIISLFSDGRVASRDDLPVGKNSLRGVWFDAIQDRFGSLLWLIQREKTNRQTCSKAEDYARQGLAWMVLEGIAGGITALATITDRNSISLMVTITRGPNRKYDQLWRGQAGQYSQTFLLNPGTGKYSLLQ